MRDASSPPSNGAEAKAAGMLKIGEVARRAGVPTSTVKYYLGQGLLPEPVKTSRNMAYYPAETVEWVRLVRRLQSESFLPLDAIRKVLAHVDDPAEAAPWLSSHVAAGRTLDEPREAVDERALREETGLPGAELARLAAAGIVAPLGRRGRRRYSGEDAAIVRQLGRMRSAGLTPERGFGAEHVTLYRELLEELVERELRVAMDTVVGSVAPDEIARLAGQWVDGTNELISLLHRKLLRHRLEELGRRLDGSGRKGRSSKR